MRRGVALPFAYQGPQIKLVLCVLGIMGQCGFKVFRKYMNARGSTRGKQSFNAAPAWLEQRAGIFQHRIGDGFHKGLVVAKGKHVQFKTFGFYTQAAGNVFKRDSPKVWLARHRAQGRKFRVGHTDDIGPLGVTVGKGLQHADAGAGAEVWQFACAEGA